MASKLSRFFKFSLIFLLLFINIYNYGCTRRGPGEIVIWTQMSPEGRGVLQDIIERYMSQTPGIKVSQLFYETEELRSNFQIAALGGSGPDLIFGPSDQVGPFKVMDIIQPLEDFFDSTFLEEFMENSLIWYKGHLYQIADRIGNHLVLVYNRDILPVPPKDTEELISMGQKLTKDEDGDGLIDQYALVFNFREPFFFIPFLGGFGGWVMDDDYRPSLNTSASVEAFKFMLKLREKKIIPRECDYDIANTLFKKGKAAMIINGPWSWGAYAKVGINFGITRIPRIKETGLWPTPMVSALGYSINVNTKGERLENTLKLLKYLLTSEVEIEFTRVLNSIPSRKDALSHPLVTKNPLVSSSLYQMEVGKPMPIVPEMRVIWDAMRPSYQALLNGSISPEQAAEQMQREAEKKIKEIRD